MKSAKKFLSVLLCIATLFSFAIPTFAKGTLVKKVEAEFNIPHAGDTMKLGTLNVAEPDKYSAKISSIYYYDYQESKYVYLSEGDVYEQGVVYSVRIRFEANDGYVLNSYSGEESTKFYVNGEEMKGFVGTNLVETRFTAEKSTEHETQPDEPAAKPNIFQRIVSFFKYIKFQLSLLFGRIFGSRDV